MNENALNDLFSVPLMETFMQRNFFFGRVYVKKLDRQFFSDFLSSPQNTFLGLFCLVLVSSPLVHHRAMWCPPKHGQPATDVSFDSLWDGSDFAWKGKNSKAFISKCLRGKYSYFYTIYTSEYVIFLFHLTFVPRAFVEVTEKHVYILE